MCARFFSAEDGSFEFRVYRCARAFLHPSDNKADGGGETSYEVLLSAAGWDWEPARPPAPIVHARVHPNSSLGCLTGRS